MVSQAEVLALVDQGRTALQDQAAAGQCTQAEETREQVRHHLPPDHPSQLAWEPAVIDALARCWATRATAETSVEAIRRARQLNHRLPAVTQASEALADTWQSQAEQAVTDGDTIDAYHHLRKALLADPSRSHLRRQAEELRDLRLGLNQPPPEDEPAP